MLTVCPPLYSATSRHRTDVIRCNADVSARPDATRLPARACSYALARLPRAWDQGAWVLGFEYAVYALGARMHPPLDLWGEHPSVGGSRRDGLATIGNRSTGRTNEAVKEDGNAYNGTKPKGITWLKRTQARITAARSVLVVGGAPHGTHTPTYLASVLRASRPKPRHGALVERQCTRHCTSSVDVRPGRCSIRGPARAAHACPHVMEGAGAGLACLEPVEPARAEVDGARPLSVAFIERLHLARRFGAAQDLA
ncbi:hypothetical protein FB451DRAFT_1167822 [Mycena latifolia]|nr:hypothetical protein FB451DRAFT_1167822 [Mycena latifolia]